MKKAAKIFELSGLLISIGGICAGLVYFNPSPFELLICTIPGLLIFAAGRIVRSMAD